MGRDRLRRASLMRIAAAFSVAVLSIAWFAGPALSANVVAARPMASSVHADELTGVSCVTMTACFAVGEMFGTGGTSRTLTERWNDKVWSIISSPNVTGYSINGLTGV